MHAAGCRVGSPGIVTLRNEMSGERQHYGLTLGVLTFAATAYALQQTMVVPALPELQRELDASTTWVTWVMTGFLLASAVLTPILGKLGDRFGKERLLVFSLAAFLVGCIGCAFAPDIWTLIAFRMVSGAAGAVFPLSFGIIRDEFPPDRMKVGIGLLSAVFGIGGGLGLVLSGVIVDNTSWRWIFGVGAAAVAIAIVLVRRFVPESPVRSSARIDVPGAVLLSVVLVALLVALSEGGSWGWTSPATLGLFAASAAAAVLWVVLELHVDEPLVDIRVLAERPVLLTNVTALISGFAMFASFVLVPRFAEAPNGLPADVADRVDYGFGASATTIGLYLLPGSVLILFAGPVAGLLGRPDRLQVAAGDRDVPDRRLDDVARRAPRRAMAGDRVDGRAEPRRRIRLRRHGGPDHRGRRPHRDRHRHRDQHGDAHHRRRHRRPGRRRDPHRGDARRHRGSHRERVRDRVRPRRRRRLDCDGDRHPRDTGAATRAPGARGRGGMSATATTDARRVADAVGGLLAALTRQRRPSGDPDPGTLSTFQAIVLSALADQGPVRLGSLADTLGTTDATASRNVDVLERQGLAERRPDPDDARGVIVAATSEGLADVRRRRRQLERLAQRALDGLAPDEARRVADAIVELQTLLDRR